MRSSFSILDRLLDDHPDQEKDVPISGAQTLNLFRESIRRDIEALLNATKPWLSASPHQSQLAVSPLNFGLADVTASVLSSDAERERIRNDIKTAITLFEPRLDSVQVTLLPDEAPLSSAIPLSIEAVILWTQEPELIRYKTAIMTTDEPVMLRPMRGD